MSAVPMMRLDKHATMPTAVYREAEAERLAALRRHRDETPELRAERLGVHRSVHMWKGDS